jgi:hypothetical protein
MPGGRVKRVFCAAAILLAALLTFPAASLGAADLDTVFRRLVITDRDGFGTEALRLLVPKTWSFSGGVAWNYAKLPPRP